MYSIPLLGQPSDLVPQADGKSAQCGSAQLRAHGFALAAAFSIGVESFMRSQWEGSFGARASIRSKGAVGTVSG